MNESKRELIGVVVSDKADKTITVKVNGEDIILNNKENYVFVDIFDHYEFDLTRPKGSGIVTNLNGKSADFLEELNDGDTIDIYWKDKEE